LSATPAPQVGGEFGDYRIDALLGRGAMGVVYRAWQRRMNRAVALKVLPADLAQDPTYRARFAREAAALARLDSPHVIQIYDHGDLDGHLYLAMQLVQGPDLGRLIEGGGLSPRRALRIAEQVAAALGDGHAVGVVHRDVKPSNVLVRPRAEHDSDGEDADFVYLCDFGIARSAADVAGAPETAGIIGTLGYLAPERLAGQPASPASDVYSLGCLLWALLVGSAPYDGSQPEVIMSHMRAPVPQLDGTDHRTTLVNALLAGTMAKDPAQRPSIGDVRRQIRQILAVAGEGAVSPRAAPTLPDNDPPRRRRIWPFAVGGLVLVAAVLLTWVLWLDPSRTAEQRLDRATPTGARCQATAVPKAAADAGGLAQRVCRVGEDVGELRLIAFGGLDDDAFGRVAGQDVQALPRDDCPTGIPAKEGWSRDGRSGTLLCFVLGPNTRYAWSFQDEDVVAVLDGAPLIPYPRDLGAVEAFFTAATYPG
jgi:serine/threonine-protein kinase